MCKHIAAAEEAQEPWPIEYQYLSRIQVQTSICRRKLKYWNMLIILSY